MYNIDRSGGGRYKNLIPGLNQRNDASNSTISWFSFKLFISSCVFQQIE